MHSAGVIEYVVIGVFMALMILTAIAFRRFSANVSDYFRAGCRSVWWLAGGSAFMGTFSAWTFTGAAGVAYVCGWSVLVIFMANVAGYAAHALFLAPRFRQLRALSVPEVIRLRFGTGTQQFYAWSSILNPVFSSLTLYGVSIFASTVFGFPIEMVIITIGVVVLLCSFLGGNWAVMANDFLQMIILIPMTALIAALCLWHAGGISAFFGEITSQGLDGQFKFFKDSGFTQDSIDFTIFWAVAIFVNTLVGHLSLGSASRYFAVKDGAEARKAAAFAGALQAFGVLVWFIPPITARLFFSSEVSAVPISNPAEASYAIAGMKLLPLGMVGMMAAAIFSATMSSMDHGLNGCSAVFINDIYPALCRLFGRKPWEGRKLFILAQVWTVLLGCAIILIALYMSSLKGCGIFSLMLNAGAVIGLPLGIPLIMGLIVRRSPSWAALTSVAAGGASSLLGFLAGSALLADIPLLCDPWKWHNRVAVTIACGALAYLATLPFWKRSPESYKRQVDEFFGRMATPVDFAKEVGEGNDARQLRVIGLFSILLGSLTELLLILPNPWGLNGRLGIVAVGGTGIAVGCLMVFVAWRRSRPEKRLETEEEARQNAVPITLLDEQV